MPALRGPADMRTAILRTLPEKTGHTLDEWLAIVRGTSMTGHKQRVDWLRTAYGLGGSTAYLLVSEADKPADYVEPSADELLAKQYAGTRAAQPTCGAARRQGRRTTPGPPTTSSWRSGMPAQEQRCCRSTGAGSKRPARWAATYAWRRGRPI